MGMEELPLMYYEEEFGPLLMELVWMMKSPAGGKIGMLEAHGFHSNSLMP